MANLSIKDQKFNYTPTGQGTVQLTTSNKYLDKDIIIEDKSGSIMQDNGSITLIPQDGVVGLTSSGLVLETTAPQGNYYTITATGKGKISAEATSSVIITGGYIPGQTVNLNSSANPISSNTATIEKYIPQSTLSADSVTAVPGEEQTVTIGAGYYPSDRTVSIEAVNTLPEWGTF